MKTGFTIKRKIVRAKDPDDASRVYVYETHRLSGWLNGRRIREQFKSREEAEGRKNILEVQAANLSRRVELLPTRLSAAQLEEAEAAFRRLDGKSLTAAVDWFLTTYRPPQTAMPLAKATESFLAGRALHVRPVMLRNYRHTMAAFNAAFPQKCVHEITTEDVQAFLAARKVGAKRFNNLRGELHTLFAYCRSAPRAWVRENPVSVIPWFKVARGLPEIITAQKAAELMAYVESYRGSPRSNLPAGCLVPYFALALFAGLRPSVKNGEIAKLACDKNLAAAINLQLGVIRLSPEQSKVKSVRQVKIQPNLAAWLMRYPLGQFPILPLNARRMINHVRHKFGIGPDVLRHTFISMHVAKFKSLGEAALEAGNSEAMIKRHYLNLVSVADAEAFWSIEPGAVCEIIQMKTHAS